MQGVYFRQSTLMIAGKYGVKGWVRNTMDGRVEAVIEGDAQAVDEMVEWCRHGPTSARVTHVEMLEERYENEFQDFRVKYSL